MRCATLAAYEKLPQGPKVVLATMASLEYGSMLANQGKRPLLQPKRGAFFYPDVAVFAAYRRHSERPEVAIEKRPALRLKQGAFALVGEHGAVLKAGRQSQPKAKSA